MKCLVDEQVLAERIECNFEELFEGYTPDQFPPGFVKRALSMIRRKASDMQALLEMEKEHVLELASEYIKDEGDFELLHDDVHLGRHRRSCSTTIAAVPVPVPLKAHG